MNKILRYSFILVLAMISNLSFAQTVVVFDATADLSAEGATAGATSITKDGVTVAISEGIMGNAKEYRCYKGQTMTVSSANTITSIVVTCTAKGEVKYGPGCFTVAPETYTFEADGKIGTWTGSAAEVAFTAASNQVRMTKIEVTCSTGGVVVTPPAFSVPEGVYTSEQSVELTADAGSKIYYTLDGTEPTDASTLYTAPIAVKTSTTITAKAYDAEGNASVTKSATYTFPVAAANIAAVKAMEKGTVVELTLTDAQVVYVNMYNDNVDCFVRDATGAIDFYTTGLEMRVNQILNGKVILEYSPYNGMPELVACSATNDDNINFTDGAEAQPVVVTVADLQDGKYMCDLVTLNNVGFTSEESGKYTNYYAVDNAGTDKVMVYDKFKIGVEFPANADMKYTVTGVLGSANLSGNIVNEVFPVKPIEETSTGIEGVEIDDNAQKVIYNLAGQRLNAPVKGINIINGKKVVVK